jgi:three-Cys-motif partner protein
VAVPKTVVWERDPHTKAKHNILRFYLDAYFPILASSTWSSAGLSFVDAFAGPGEYKDGSLGSPIIAVTSASRVVAEHATDIRVVLVEKEADRFEHLHSMVEEMAIPDRVSVTMTQGACEQVLVTELDRLGLWNAPMFVNFDGWGVDTPFELIRRVGSGRRPEVLVTFGSQWFTRFAGQEEVGAGDRVFGDQGWRAVANLATPSEKKRFLVDEYRRRLTQAGFEYHLTFELVDEGGNPLFLVFGTGSDRGVEKMKDAMWRVDSASGSKFRDPRDRNQMAFELSDNDPDLTLLRQQILEQLDSGPKTLAELQRFALLETVFKKGHARTAVDELETARRVVCQHRQAYDRFVVTKAPDSLF